MRYYKRYWDEPRGDAHNSWGQSWWYFEADDIGTVLRQIEVYDDGPTLRYHEGRLHDEFGMLTDQPLEFADFPGFEIGSEEFERAWAAGD